MLSGAKASVRRMECLTYEGVVEGSVNKPDADGETCDCRIGVVVGTNGVVALLAGGAAAGTAGIVGVVAAGGVVLMLKVLEGAGVVEVVDELDRGP